MVNGLENFGSFFNIFFFLLILGLIIIPQVRYRWLTSARKNQMMKMGTERSSNIISIIHRQESIGLFGIPFYRFINMEDSEQVLRAIRMTPDEKPIDLIMHTPGGLVLAASQIAQAMKDHPAKTTVIVPHYAMSGGTLIALAADEIIMDHHAVLGPVDPQLMQYPAPSLLRAVDRKRAKDIDDQTLIMADVAEKAINQVRDFVHSLLKERLGDEKAKELSTILTEGRWTHDYPITSTMAKELGLNVNNQVPEEVYTLMGYYPQPMFQRQVEFVPSPKRRRDERQKILD
ncbi:MAG: ATP-dependent Clp protease proteolytic subunit [Archaeoglobaceae archaeon]